MTGRIVMANAGRDKGRFFVVTGGGEEYLLIADGKTRKLASPKRKSLKHLKLTNTVVEVPSTDKALRAVLHSFNYAEPSK